MFGLGLPEIIIIFVIALLVFGPKKLPDLGKSIGRAMAEFKKASEDFQETVRTEMKEVEKSTDVKEELKKIEQSVQGGTTSSSTNEGQGDLGYGDESKEKKAGVDGNS